jgi:hypothetical protein
MQIESIIKRRNGHAVTLDGQTYEFRPPAYTAEVNEPSHIERFLAISEGYFALGGDERDTLADQYLERFGRKPHHRMSVERIRAELEAE